MVLFSSCSTVLLISGSTTGGRHSTILHVYTQRLRASVVLQYTLEHLANRFVKITRNESTEAEMNICQNLFSSYTPGLLDL